MSYAFKTKLRGEVIKLSPKSLPESKLINAFKIPVKFTKIRHKIRRNNFSRY